MAKKQKISRQKIVSEIAKKGFESKGHDVVGGGMRLGRFEPK